MYISNVCLDENADSIEFLLEANNTSNLIWLIYIKLAIAAMFGIVFISITSVIVCWLNHNDFDVRYFFHLFQIMFVNYFLCSIISGTIQYSNLNVVYLGINIHFGVTFLKCAFK